jgi:predicted ATPase/DNA-binding winged helix-turn-helix (wHTH) protein
MNPPTQASASLEFGRFQVFPQRRELVADGRPLRLGGRAFDLLMILIEARGALVSKDTLMARAWPDRMVEENNLQAQIVGLRKALGADRGLIRTVAGRGYQFTGEIRILPASQNPGEDAVATRSPPGDGSSVDENGTGSDQRLPVALPPTNLPEPISELVGRDNELNEILSHSAAHRLVTLTGPGGIGKTRLALAAAHRLLPHFVDGVWLVELSPLADPGLVPATVAAAIKFELGTGVVSAESVANSVSAKRLLLVLDNCEHVIDAAAMIAEAVLRAASAVRIIATSREPLRVEGEQIYPVPPLAIPSAEGDDPWQYGAVWLFLTRLRASGVRAAEDRHAGTAIAAICRRLDGIPLAIELAAARAAVLGVEGLAARLNDRFRVLAGGRRTALPRHQTLRATLDWSYELLAGSERALLHRLSVFAGSFSLEEANAVAASPGITPTEAVTDLASLVAKSLVTTEGNGTVGRYRLLDTMRAYALEKLEESGELEAVARRHAEYYRDLFERAETELPVRPIAEWLGDYGHRIDNLRAALDWAFSPNGDAPIGMALTAAAVPVWMHLSLLEECRSRVERALAALAGGASPDARSEMKLYTALAASLIYTAGAAGAQSSAVWSKAFEIAESLDDAEYRLRSLWALWVFHTNSGRHRVALELAQRFSAVAAARPDLHDRLIGERVIGVSQLYLGDLDSARRHLERVVADYDASDEPSRMIRFQGDQRVIARVPCGGSMVAGFSGSGHAGGRE